MGTFKDQIIGSTDDAAATSDTGNFTLIALFKRLLAKVTPSGVAGVPSADVVTVQGVAGMTPLTAYPTPMEGVLLASLARTTHANSEEMVNSGFRGIDVFVNVTSAPGAETVQAILQFKDPVSGEWQNAHTPTAVSGTGLRTYQTYPGGGAGNLTGGVSVALARTWRVRMVHSSTGSWTYSVGYSLLP